MERREFIKGVAAAGVASTMSGKAWAQFTANESNPAANGIAYRTLGRTGERVSAIGLGGAHMAGPKVTETESIRLVRSAIDGGINFLDNSWDYNHGDSEVRMGKALKDGYRQKAFLMTKLDGRTKEEAHRQIEESLVRLQTDHLDLIQHHEIIRFDDPDRIFAEGGAQEAVLEARQAGKVRYIGFTGHKDPHIHLYMLQKAAEHGWVPDTVQMPLNVMDAHFRSFGQLVLPKLVEQKIGVLGMKPMGSGVILKSNTVTAQECLRYALSLPTSVVITGIDKMEILQQALEIARNFRPMGQDEMAAVLGKTQTAAAKGEYELFKTSQHFDSTMKHPEWLGGEAPGVAELGEGTS